MKNKENYYQTQDQIFLENKCESYGFMPSKIYSEEFNTEYNHILQNNWWIISDNLPDYSIVGLKEKINEINGQSINLFIEKHKLSISKEDVVNIILTDFIKKFDFSTKSGFDTYNLVFSKNEVIEEDLKRKVKIENRWFEYNVIYFEDLKNYKDKNSFFLIREKRFYLNPSLTPEQRIGGGHQRPDYAIYMNGIPIAFIEYKTEDSGLQESIKDLDEKITYKKMPFYIATNGKECAVITNTDQFNVKDREGNCVFLWKNYHHKKYLNQQNNQEYTDTQYFYDEILCQPKNLYFYMKQCTDLDHRKKILKNARVQQYFATKSMCNYLDTKVIGKVRQSFNMAIVHTQRSGKTITMKMISKMILDFYHEQYNTIFIYAPDLQIKKVLTDEIGQQQDQLYEINVIETRNQFIKAVKSLNTGHTTKQIYILNMQKISTEDIASSGIKTYSGHNVLNIIDEGHHGQTGDIADKRNEIFPNASNLLFTATLKSDTYVHYLGATNANSAKDNILDIFSYSQAKASDIVVNVIYTKPKKFMELCSDKMKDFGDEIEDKMGRKIDINNIDYDNIDETSEDQSAIANKKIVKELMNRLNKEILPEKLEYIASFHNEVQNTLMFEDKKLFISKSIIYTATVAQAKEMIAKIQEKEGLIKENCIQGIRFGIDYSNMTPEDCELLNPGISDPSMIDVNFKSNNTDNKNRIDILIAVNKYQKGYDLPELMIVFLDKTISEPSLINQIYTRPATKKKYKLVGYCVDLTLGRVNLETFRLSLELYDKSENISEYFIEEGGITKLQQDFKNSLDIIKKELSLRDDEFLKDLILEKVLNEPNLELRKKRQYNFFNQAKLIFKHIAKLGSPLYFKEYRLAIKALYDAFIEFKDIYAHVDHPEHNKILITLDNNQKEYFLSKAEINNIIDQVLFTMNEKSLSSLINFNYDLDSISNELTKFGSFTNEDFEKFKTKKKNELNKQNLENQLRNIEDYLKEHHRSLYDEIMGLFSMLNDDHSKIYSEDIQNKIETLKLAINEQEKTLKNLIDNEFNGDYVIYLVYQELKNLFINLNEENLKSFYKFIAHHVKNEINAIESGLPKGLHTKEKLDILIEEYKGRSIKNLIGYLSEYNRINNLQSDISWIQQFIPYKVELNSDVFLEKILPNVLTKKYFHYFE